MSQPQIIEFALRGSIAGHAISARQGVPFLRFAEFNDEVQKYVQGSDGKNVLQDVQVQIEEGSYLLRVLIPAGILSSLVADTSKLTGVGDLADVDPNRAKVVLHWQQRARMEKSLAYIVRSPIEAFSTVTVTAESTFRRVERVQWVQVERYLIGEITDWGGTENVNVHLRLRNSKEVIIVDASADQIRTQRENLVYQKAIVQVRAKQNPKNGDLKDYKLIKLSAYGPKVEESRLQELFAKGAVAWAGVPDSNAWVEEIRGGVHV